MNLFKKLLLTIRRSFLFLFFLSLLLFTLVISLTVKEIQVLRMKALTIPLEIIVDGAFPQALPKIWQNFAQGGEEKDKMIEPIRNEVTLLEPKYIRIDHLFDFYDVVSRNENGKIVYNWNQLDERIQEILETGALPFLSLSYLPPAFSHGSITGKPTSFNEWRDLIKATIERYSGHQGKNILFIYYEVWNEPDHFGKMSPEDYFLFYQSAAEAAASADDVSPFKFGGPATIGVNRTWMNNFLGAIRQSGIRLDFVSWHSYGNNPQKIKLESRLVDSLESFQPFKGKVEKLVTEWGPDSEINPLNDSYFSASHAVASLSQATGDVDKVFAFELKDGLDPLGRQLWGRWGLITHQKVGLFKKPRYHIFPLLNQLKNFSLPVSQNSQNIYTLASTDGLGNYTLVLTFFPYQGITETKNFLIKIINFLPGEFTQTLTFLDPFESLQPQEKKIISTGTVFEGNFSLKSFSTLLVNLKRNSPTFTKTGGQAANPTDKSAHVVSPLPSLIYPLLSSLQEENQTGEISFWLKPSWDGDSPEGNFFFETRFSPSTKLYALKRPDGFSNRLEFIFEQGEIKKDISLNITNWEKGNWYHVSFSWDNPKMEMTLKVNETKEKESLGVIGKITLGKFISIGSDAEGRNQINADIDNLEIIINNRLLYQDRFDEEN